MLSVTPWRQSIGVMVEEAFWFPLVTISDSVCSMNFDRLLNPWSGALSLWEDSVWRRIPVVCSGGLGQSIGPSVPPPPSCRLEQGKFHFHSHLKFFEFTPILNESLIARNILFLQLISKFSKVKLWEDSFQQPCRYIVSWCIPIYLGLQIQKLKFAHLLRVEEGQGHWLILTQLIRKWYIRMNTLAF